MKTSQRIVSFLPAATEIACALGLADRLVGITHECDYPTEIEGKPAVVRSALPIATMSQREIDLALRKECAADRVFTKSMRDSCANSRRI